MVKRLLITLILFLSISNTSFACCKCGQGLTATNDQKACQNVFSFLTIDFSFLSPRATAADVHVGHPKFWKPESCAPYCPQTCPCPPQCCPCQPQCCPQQCPKQSMEPNESKKEIPVCNKQVTNNQCPNPQNKKSMFRLDLFRTFKLQIL